jgi:hypothetical protein
MKKNSTLHKGNALDNKIEAIIQEGKNCLSFQIRHLKRGT